MLFKKDSSNKFPNWKGKKLLIVDDAPENLRILEIFLKSTKAQIDTALNGKIALDKFKSSHYDLILLDINMPVLNGFETLKEIKSIKPESKVVACTGTSSEVNVNQFKEEGFDSYLKKPVALDSILRNLRPLIS